MKGRDASGRSREATGGACPARAPVRCLLVDDEVPFTEVLAKRLARRGFSVETAMSGEKAIRVLRKKEFDIAVLDLKLTDMDGIEILKIFKKMVPELPVIMLTGHGCEIAAQEGLRFGASAYLTKPCEVADLIDAIMSVVRTGEKDHEAH
ncbi:MAG: response regulator [Pseudomonadota bacterium]